MRGDPPVRELRPRITRPLITDGLGTDDHDSAPDVSALHDARGVRIACTVCPSADAGRVELGESAAPCARPSQPAECWVQWPWGLEVGVTFGRTQPALKQFHGAERRSSFSAKNAASWCNDYGHHPTEIAAVIAAARAGIDRRVMVVFQPHRYSRTSQLMREFGTALGAADEVVLTDIYAAGEAPLPGVTVDALAETVRQASSCPVHVVSKLDALPAAVRGVARRGDLIVTLGARSTEVAERILEATATSEMCPGARSHGVRAPTERNFRRARVKPHAQGGAKGISWRWCG